MTETLPAAMDVRKFYGSAAAPSPKPKPTMTAEVSSLYVALEGEASTAREVAKKVGMEKHRVNQLLYANPSLFEEVGKKKTAPVWAAKTDAPKPEETGSIQMEAVKPKPVVEEKPVITMEQVAEQIAKERETGVFSPKYDLGWRPPLVDALLGLEIKQKRKELFHVWVERDGSKRHEPHHWWYMGGGEPWDWTMARVDEWLSLGKAKVAELLALPKAGTEDKRRDALWVVSDTRKRAESLERYKRTMMEWKPTRSITLRVSYRDNDWDVIAAEMEKHPEMEVLFAEMRRYKAELDELNARRKNKRRNCRTLVHFTEEGVKVDSISWEIWREDAVHSHRL